MGTGVAFLRSAVASKAAISSRRMVCALAGPGLRMTAAESSETAVAGRAELTAEQLERGPGIPSSESEMVSTAATAVRAAFKDGKTRQKLRFLLPRDGKLNPTDEDWPGGIMELFAACSPLTRSFLRKLSSSEGGVGAKCTEQRLDESGVDGVSLWSAQAENPANDLSAFCQPSGEQLDEIKMVCKSAGPRLVLMINPQWRETLDSSVALRVLPSFSHPRHFLPRTHSLSLTLTVPTFLSFFSPFPLHLSPPPISLSLSFWPSVPHSLAALSFIVLNTPLFARFPRSVSANAHHRVPIRYDDINPKP